MNRQSGAEALWESVQTLDVLTQAERHRSALQFMHAARQNQTRFQSAASPASPCSSPSPAATLTELNHFETMEEGNLNPYRRI